jgi:uncharacterized protein YfaT (DUF1175 family)
MFKNRRGILITIVLTVLLIVIAILFFRVEKVIFAVQPKVLFADSKSIVTISIKLKNILNLNIPFYSPKLDFFVSEGNNLIGIENSDENDRINIRSKNEPGRVVLSIKVRNRVDSELVIIPILPAFSLAEHNGFPDILKITDEEDKLNFRRWFNMIALTQFYQKDDKWVDRDCAGLVRFCFREALKKHDNNWLKKKKFLYDINIPDVKKYNYPNIPLLRERIFRTNPEKFNLSDTSSADSIFRSFVEAKYLKDYNMTFISKNIEESLPGDVIFFLNDVDPKWPFHTIIFLGSDKIGKIDKSDDWVIYHTGPDEKNPGMVKKIKLSDLRNHPNKRWRPIQTNPYFLGFFRWKILD